MSLEKQTALLSTAYLAPIQYYSKLYRFPEIYVEHYEHFPKQTYRNRCHIYGANGLLPLSIPLKKYPEKTIAKNIQIAYDYHWQKIHWKSIESAYRCSPFFEFYEQDFIPFYTKKYTYLVDFNEALQYTVIKLLKIKTELKNTVTYQKENPDKEDLRDFISPKKNYDADKSFIPKPYLQVFQNKHDFIPNLSIIDLLFNQGPSSLEYIL